MTSSPAPHHPNPPAAGASGAGCPPSDAEAVADLLGRPPFTDFRVAVRCPFGRPAILENDPVDLHGRPFPTRYWLACRGLNAAVSTLEAAGGVRAAEDDPALAPAIVAAHRAHARVHAGHHVGGVADERRVKCLHAQLAFALATGGNPVGDWITQRLGSIWPAACCVPDRAAEVTA